MIGGFHVSGCIAMLDGTAVDLDRARELGVSIFAGEAEGRFEMLLRDAAGDGVKPQYDFTKDLVDMAGQPSPFLPIQYVKRTAGTYSSSIRAAVARFSVHSARLSTYRAENRGHVRLMMSKQ